MNPSQAGLAFDCQRRLVSAEAGVPMTTTGKKRVTVRLSDTLQAELAFDFQGRLVLDDAGVPQPKPRKPPPHINASTKHNQPKLPDKSPAADPHPPDKVANTDEKHTKKKEDSSSDKPTQPQPPTLPNRKPVLPPPVGKKPMPPRPDPPSSSKPDAHSTVNVITADHKDNKNISKEESVDAEVNLDNVQSSEKLIHLTANRAKGPKKRPPSQFIANDKDEEKESVVKDEKPSTEKEVKEKESDKHLPPSRPADPAGVNLGVFHSTVDDLKKEIQELRANSVSKSAYNELKAENEKLRSEFDSFKSSTIRKLRELIQEVDEEKKIRLNTQVDVERVKKMMIETNI